MSSILFLDSLIKIHNKNSIAKLIRMWLNFEWDRSSMRDANGFVKSPFNEDHMKLKSPIGKPTV